MNYKRGKFIGNKLRDHCLPNKLVQVIFLKNDISKDVLSNGLSRYSLQL